MSDTHIRREVKTHIRLTEGLDRFVEANNIVKGISSFGLLEIVAIGTQGGSAETMIMILIRQTGQRS